MENTVIRNYKRAVGELSPDGVFHLRVRYTENWVKHQGWAIESLTVYLAKEAGAENIELLDEESGDVWKTDLQTLEDEGYELCPYAKSIVYTILPPEYWDVYGLEGIE